MPVVLGLKQLYVVKRQRTADKGRTIRRVGSPVYFVGFEYESIPFYENIPHASHRRSIR